jgi:hypothetical protein
MFEAGVHEMDAEGGGPGWEVHLAVRSHQVDVHNDFWGSNREALWRKAGLFGPLKDPRGWGLFSTSQVFRRRFGLHPCRHATEFIHEASH